MTNYATVSDILARGYTLTAEQSQASEILIQEASAKLRILAERYSFPLESEMQNEDFALAVKSVVIQAVIRALNSLKTASSAVGQASQTTESIGSYSLTATYSTPNLGQVVYFLNNELKELGIKRQRYGAIELYGE